MSDTPRYTKLVNNQPRYAGSAIPTANGLTL